MTKQVLRIYVDTSVFGGVFDKEFAEPTKIFLHQASLGFFQLVTSVAVRNEIRQALEQVQSVFARFSQLLETVRVNEDALRLRTAYIQSGILTEKNATDALHVAMATVAQCAAIVSWNFKHIVQRRRIHGFEAVNTLMDYRPPEIFSPREIIEA